jgi:hypothetical protein
VSSDGREPPSRSFAVATGDGKLAAPNLLILQGLGSELVCSQDLLCIGQGQRSRGGTVSATAGISVTRFPGGAFPIIAENSSFGRAPCGAVPSEETSAVPLDCHQALLSLSLRASVPSSALNTALTQSRRALREFSTCGLTRADWTPANPRPRAACQGTTCAKAPRLPMQLQASDSPAVQYHWGIVLTRRETIDRVKGASGFRGQHPLR